MSITIGTIPHILDQVSVRLTYDGPFKSAAPTVDVLAANNVQVLIDYECERGDFRPTILRIKCADFTSFNSEGLNMIVDPTYDIMPFISEREVEELEEMIVKRGQE